MSRKVCPWRSPMHGNVIMGAKSQDKGQLDCYDPTIFCGCYDIDRMWHYQEHLAKTWEYLFILPITSQRFLKTMGVLTLKTILSDAAWSHPWKGAKLIWGTTGVRASIGGGYGRGFKSSSFYNSPPPPLSLVRSPFLFSRSRRGGGGGGGVTCSPFTTSLVILTSFLLVPATK